MLTLGNFQVRQFGTAHSRGTQRRQTLGFFRNRPGRDYPMADVTGHGIGPAMLASVCRAYSRASFNDRDDLATTLQNINRSFSEDLTPERFATFVAVVFEEDDEKLELLS